MKIIKQGARIYAYCTFTCERCGCVFQAENDEILRVGDKFEFIENGLRVTPTDEVWCNCPHCGKTCYNVFSSVLGVETPLSEESESNTDSVG